MSGYGYLGLGENPDKQRERIFQEAKKEYGFQKRIENLGRTPDQGLSSDEARERQRTMNARTGPMKFEDFGDYFKAALALKFGKDL
jgi:hypothetical protein